MKYALRKIVKVIKCNPGYFFVLECGHDTFRNRNHAGRLHCTVCAKLNDQN